MKNAHCFYIGGRWTTPIGTGRGNLVDPCSETAYGTISLGNADDVNAAVSAAKHAFVDFSRTSVDERLGLLTRIVSHYQRRRADLEQAIMQEIGAPAWLARDMHVPAALAHFTHATEVLRDYPWSSRLASSQIVREPIGVCGLITAWNFPLMLVTSKLAYALAAGCTVVLKPSEIAPLSNLVLAEILHEAGTPAGVFNLVNGDGAGVGHALCAHPDVDMISFTGSTRAGILVAKTAADTIKRVHQELGGKSANIILPDARLEEAVPAGVLRAFTNSGQACIAPTRMLVHKSQISEAIELARTTASNILVGRPDDPRTRLGPVVTQTQYDRVQAYIQVGLNEGATLVAGGLGRPPGLERGYYVRPTVFADVSPGMTIAREEIFGPVLSMITYETEEEAIRIANDTDYGLGAYVHSSSLEHAREVAPLLRAGRIYINLAVSDTVSPFGGYKRSGNGREYGRIGFEEFLEVKAILGYERA